MKHSIRKQILMAFLIIMTGTILLCWFLNSRFLERYYIYNKQQVMLKAYELLNKATQDGSIQSDDFEAELQKISGVYNISVIIIDADSRLIQSAGSESDILVKTLLDRVFSQSSDNYKLLEENDHYIMEIARSTQSDLSFIQMWGTLDNGNLFMTRTLVQSIRDSVSVSNRFLAYIGIFTVGISAVVIMFITKKITNPILSLTEISKRMADLDFEVHYNGKEKNEIGVLGEHMNALSDKLESTISELKTANNELQKDIEKKEQIDEMRREFLSNVSHELKTPLSVIIASTEAFEDNPKETKWITNIKNESSRMSLLITNLLELAASESKEAFKLEEGNLSKAVELSVLTFEGRAFESNVKLEYNIPENIKMKMDENSIKQLIEILLDNAIKHAEKGSIINVNLLEENNSITILVKNKGEEIPKGEEEKIFERFYRKDKSRNRNDNRYGLGLAIAKNIVTNHNGKISAFSKDGITTFKILFKR